MTKPQRVSELVAEIRSGALVLKPPFQRRLVWTNKVKDYFLETVHFGLPFPEIFVATGKLDTKSMERKNLLVDGQQRITTLKDYVSGSPDLKLKKVKPYKELTEDERTKFLDYQVSVRDLGVIDEATIKDVFARMNTTDYALKAMERLNAVYNGELKNFCEKLCEDKFFQDHDVFSLNDYRRMRDIDFCVILVTTLLSTYYNRDELNREYLGRYNDAFPQAKKMKGRLRKAFAFIQKCKLDDVARVWRKTDLFTLIVEVDAALAKASKITVATAGKRLRQFYKEVDEAYQLGEAVGASSVAPQVFKYLKAATKATNDKYARVNRGEVIGELLQRR
jgi:hypothetical protein